MGPRCRATLRRASSLHPRSGDLDDLDRFQFLSFHPLRGNREGQFAAKLTGKWRLIVEPGEDERTLWVVEVEDYHG